MKYNWQKTTIKGHATAGLPNHGNPDANNHMQIDFPIPAYKLNIQPKMNMVFTMLEVTVFKPPYASDGYISIVLLDVCKTGHFVQLEKHIDADNIDEALAKARESVEYLLNDMTTDLSTLMLDLEE